MHREHDRVMAASSVAYLSNVYMHGSVSDPRAPARLPPKSYECLDPLYARNVGLRAP